MKGLEYEMARQFIPLNIHRALEADSSEALPLSSPEYTINKPVDDISKFDDISFNKGEGF